MINTFIEYPTQKNYKETTEFLMFLCHQQESGRCRGYGITTHSRACIK